MTPCGGPKEECTSTMNLQRMLLRVVKIATPGHMRVLKRKDLQRYQTDVPLTPVIRGDTRTKQEIWATL